MALQLKTDTGENKDKTQPADNQPDYGNESLTGYKPVVIKTDIPDIDAISENRKKKEQVSKIIKAGIFLLVILVAVFIAKGLIKKHSTKDITKYVNLSEAEIESSLGINLEDSPEKIKSIHQYSNGKITVSSDGDISVVYINGVQKGVKIDNKKYSMFNVKIGDAANKAQEKMTYDYSDYFEVLNDLYSGKSTTDYYYNKEKNDCLILIINDTSGRVVSMTYYNDFAAISENLSGLDD